MASFTVSLSRQPSLVAGRFNLTLDTADNSVFRVHVVGLGYSEDVLRFAMWHTDEKHLTGIMYVYVKAGNLNCNCYVEKLVNGVWEETEFYEYTGISVPASNYFYVRAAGIEYSTVGLGEVNRYCIIAGFDSSPPSVIEWEFASFIAFGQALTEPKRADAKFMYWNIQNEGDRTRYIQDEMSYQPFKFINGRTYTATAVWKPRATPYINTGTSWRQATAYIDNGETWQQYKPYI